MKTQDQSKRPKEGFAAVATASALGLSGLALADSNDGPTVPDPIVLEDRPPVTEVTVAKITSITLAGLGINVATVTVPASPSMILTW